jgi:hypothetical protein
LLTVVLMQAMCQLWRRGDNTQGRPPALKGAACREQFLG